MINRESDYLNLINISEDDLKPKKKEKKKKEIIRNFFLINKRRRTRKEPSDVAKITGELIKKKLTTPEEIQNYFNVNFKSIDKRYQTLYQTLVGSRVLNGSMRVSDILTNKPMYEYFFFKGIKTKTISNDRLYLYSLLSSLSEIKNYNEAIKSSVKYGNISKVTFCSIPFKCDGNVKKGYYQDYSGSFAAIGMESLNEEERKNILDGKGLTFEFDINGQKYISRGNNNACLIARSNVSMEDCKKKYEAMKIINVTNKVSLNEKTIEVDNKVKFIDSKVSSENFCPAFLTTPEEVSYNVLFKVGIDYNRLFMYAQEYLSKTGKIYLPFNAFYWTTMQQCFDFIGVFGVTANIREDQKKTINILYSKYNELKNVLNLWKENQLKYQKILLDFYHSFNSKVKFDNLIALSTKLNEYIEIRDILLGDENYKEVYNFIVTCKEFGGMIYNQFNQKVFSIADKLKQALFKLNIGETVNLIKDFREIGNAIYRVSYMDPKEDMPAFPFIVSPGGFLGNLIAGIDIKEDPLKKILEDVENQKKNKRNVVVNQEVMINDVLKNLDMYKFKVLNNAVVNYLKKTKKNATENDVKNLTNSVYNNLGPNANATLNNLISSSIANVGNVDNVSAPEDIVKKDIDVYFLTLEKNLLKKNQQQNMINQRINELNIKKNEAADVEEINIHDPDLYMSNYTILNKYAGDKDFGKPNSPLVNYYSDIIIFSNLFGLKKKDRPNLIKNDLATLLAKYPVDRVVIDEIAIDYDIPNARESVNLYEPSDKPLGKKVYNKELMDEEVEEYNKFLEEKK